MRANSLELVNVPVVMCTWQRLYRLENSIANLGDQLGVNVNLIIWNNNSEERTRVEEIVENARAKLDVKIIHSPTNIGGIGRFHVARKLAPRSPYVIFIDDDQILPRDFIAKLYAERSDKELHSSWAFKILNTENYWDRIELEPGQRANYCGTGGMIAPTKIFISEDIFDIPAGYMFIEDLWLSYFVINKLGFKLYKSSAAITACEDMRDGLWRALGDKKSDLLRILVKRGWKLDIN